jgi:hypothetical protein
LGDLGLWSLPEIVGDDAFDLDAWSSKVDKQANGHAGGAKVIQALCHDLHLFILPSVFILFICG